MKKSLTNLKVAVYYDWLTQWGGAERVLLDILTLFPQAEIFTLFHNSQNTSWLPAGFKIHPSFINSSSPLLSPFYDLAVENFNFAKFDLVISTTTNVGHSLLTPPQSLFICYYHNLNRHLYQNQNILLSPLLKFYQKLTIFTPAVPTTQSVILKQSKTFSQNSKNFGQSNSPRH